MAQESPFISGDHIRTPHLEGTALPSLLFSLPPLPLSLSPSLPLSLSPSPHFFLSFLFFSFYISLTLVQDPKKRQCRASSRCEWWIRESEWMTRSKGGSSNASRKPTTGLPKYVRGRERREEERRERVKQYWLISYYCRNMADLVWVYPYPSYYPSFSRYSFPFIFHSFFVWLVMYICRKLAKLMNGTISLESEARKGSTFTVQLHCNRVSDSSLSSLIPTEPLSPQPTNSLELPIPPAEAGAQEEAKGEGEKAKKPTKPQRILVSEDNLMNQTLLARVLPLKGNHPPITSSQL